LVMPLRPHETPASSSYRSNIRKARDPGCSGATY
jgi:hypothetical protein